MIVPANHTVHSKNAFLDDFRFRNGIPHMKKTFHEIANTDVEKAVRLVNDANIRFPSLFILQPEIIKRDLGSRLNSRNMFSLDFSNQILNGALSSPYKPDKEHYPHLKWIFETGYDTEDVNDQYDEIMDKVAILLAKVYKDKSCLKKIERLIFSRYRKGYYIYDLVWAFFECCSPGDLLLIANRLRSPHPRDVELARQLLNFVPCVGNANGDESRMMQYRCAAKWLQHNRKYLYYTGESNQQKSNPSRFAVSGETSLRRNSR
jgi:hypothetical protein